MDDKAWKLVFVGLFYFGAACFICGSFGVYGVVGLFVWWDYYYF